MVVVVVVFSIKCAFLQGLAGTVPDVEEAPAPCSRQACSAPKQFFPAASVSVSDAALYPEGSLHRRSPGRGFLHPRRGDAGHV